MEACPYQAVLIVSFGGPEGEQDVPGFLENVLRGRDVPRERMLEVAEHYRHFGGVSPINAQNRALRAALEEELRASGPALPVYLGNRNWHPLLPDTLRRMAGEGVKKALAFFTSAYSSYSSCRQYLENLEEARRELGPTAPAIDRLRACYNHPGFLEPMAEQVRGALAELPEPRRQRALLLCTAHSIPRSMADHCGYVSQLREAGRLVAELAGHSRWELVYQSRSGPPHQPWLEPDVVDYLEQRAGELEDVLIVPIGFISDHIEVLFDLDHECAERCRELGISMRRLPTLGTDPRFVAMIGELVRERIGWQKERRALGLHGPSHDECPPGCCVGITSAVLP
ncbi:MAG: ferrochelatase [Armatimonadetes bacterium]|nr:ferrochelatase [Armatimonadota bacterium]